MVLPSSRLCGRRGNLHYLFIVINNIFYYIYNIYYAVDIIGLITSLSILCGLLIRK